MSGGDASRYPLLDIVARQLSQLGLNAPVIFFLELHRPFSHTASQLAIFFQPVLGFLMGDDNISRFSRWLADEHGLDQLIRLLETGDNR